MYVFSFIMLSVGVQNGENAVLLAVHPQDFAVHLPEGLEEVHQVVLGLVAVRRQDLEVHHHSIEEVHL